MPLMKTCPRCKALIPYGKTYCERCELLIQAEREAQKKKRDRRYNRQRDKRTERFYNSQRWRMTSRLFLNRNPKCAWCGGTATEVDHIEELKTPEGWARRWDESNFRPFCTDCHNKRHNRFVKREPRGRVKKV